ncbi:MAG TPA: hypothetical protein VGV18_09470 [Verrucomicrobiae bacterium]|nr:hypothetical protein [Verrucomicrobiae bacterium]
MPKDCNIVKRVLNGDVDAFRILVERYQRPVLSMIQRLIWDSHRSEEIAQDIFVIAFQKLPAFVKSSMNGTTAQNTAFSFLKTILRAIFPKSRCLRTIVS